MRRPVHHQEIDLIGLFEILWAGRWFLSVFLLLAALTGFFFLKTQKMLYSVSIPISYSFDYTEIGSAKAQILPHLEPPWKLRENHSKNAYSFTLLKQSESLPDIEEYSVELEQLNTRITTSLYQKADLEFLVAEEVFNFENTTRNSETAVKYLFDAKRTIVNIDNGKTALIFGDFQVNRVSPSVTRIVPLFLVLGGFLGSVFVVSRELIKRRQDKSLASGPS